jgi:hypothetical protein
MKIIRGQRAELTLTHSNHERHENQNNGRIGIADRHLCNFRNDVRPTNLKGLTIALFIVILLTVFLVS